MNRKAAAERQRWDGEPSQSDKPQIAQMIAECLLLFSEQALNRTQELYAG